MTDDLVKRLRDDESYYRWQEKHWCVDFEILDNQRLEAADRIEAQAAEIERLLEEKDRLVTFVNTLIEDVGLEYDSMRLQ